MKEGWVDKHTTSQCPKGIISPLKSHSFKECSVESRWALIRFRNLAQLGKFGR